jgi:hypothetical protein
LKAILCDDQYAARGSEFDGGPKACYTCSDNNEIRENALK